MEYIFFLNDDDIPDGFEYPKSYKEYVSSIKSLEDIEPWSFLLQLEVERRPKGLKKRYPDRMLVPFSRRIDNDDVACFDASISSDNPRVLIIHDFASPGWEGRGECDNFLKWLELARSESEEWKSR